MGGVITPVILKSNYYMEMVSFTPRPLYPRGKGHNQRMLGVTPEAGWIVDPIGNRTMTPPLTSRSTDISLPITRLTLYGSYVN